LRQALAGNP